MTRRKETIWLAGPGIEATWDIKHHADGTEELRIYLPEDLDEVARQRYLHEARAEAGWTDRRPAILPLLAPLAFAGKHVRQMAHNHTASVAIATTVVVAAGIASAAVRATHDIGHGYTDRPPIAAPAPSHPAPSPRHRRPTAAPQPKLRRSVSQTSGTITVSATLPSTPSLSTSHPFRSVRGLRRAVGAPHLPRLPMRPLHPLVPASVPHPAVCLLRLHLPPAADVRVACPTG